MQLASYRLHKQYIPILQYNSSSNDFQIDHKDNISLVKDFVKKFDNDNVLVF